MSWDAVSGADYYILRNTSNNNFIEAWTPITYADIYFTSSIYGQPSTTYGPFTVTAVNAYGSSSPSSGVNTTTTAYAGSSTGVAPGTPYLVAVPDGGAQVKLMCLAQGGDDRGIATYHYEYSTNGVSGWTPLIDYPSKGLLAAGPTGVPQTEGAQTWDTGIANGATRYYRVRTEDVDVNFSSYSNIVSSTTRSAFSSRTSPTLPATFDTSYPSAAAVRTVNCANATQLQNAFNDITDGDHIVMTADISGNFTIPSRTSSGIWVVVRTDRLGSLPAEGTRAVAADAATKMRKLTGTGGDIGLQINSGSSYIRFVGIEITNTVNACYATMINGTVGAGAVLADIPHHITFDRCYIHNAGDGTISPNPNGVRHAIAIAARYFAVVDSTIDNIISEGGESQTIYVNGGTGPVKVKNNYLRGAGESGGLFAEQPTYHPYPNPTDANPADITYEDNEISNDPSWPYAIRHICKNLLEFKQGKRILVKHNKFYNHWQGSQNGYFFVAGPKSQSVSDFSFWNDMADLTFENNLVYDVSAGLQLGRSDYPTASGWSDNAKRVAIKNNLFLITGEDDQTDPNASATDNGGLVCIQLGWEDTFVSHNTFLASKSSRQATAPTDIYSFMSLGDTTPVNRGTETKNNIVGRVYSFFNRVSDMNSHTESGWIVSYNAYTGLPYNGFTTSDFGSPMTNMSFPADETAIGFVNRTGIAAYTGTKGDYALTGGSTYHNAASDGTDLGCDVSLLPS
jgi:hypothetical protein